MTPNYRILRKPDLTAKIGLGLTQIDDQEAAGLLPRRFTLGKRAVGWAEHEVDAVIAARADGRSEDDIRRLVERLIAARAKAFEPYEAE